MRKKRLIAIAAATVGVLAVTGVGLSSVTSTPKAKAVHAAWPGTTARVAKAAAAWPGTTGLSGVQGDPSLDAASVNAFCKWRGRACNVAHTYTDRTSWASMTSDAAAWVFENFNGFKGQLVVSQGLVPNEKHGDLSACASGAHNKDFKNFGNLMVKENRANAIVRLGWEFNGTFMAWWGENATTWKKCYRNAALSIRAADPKAVFDWTINAHSTPDNVCGGVTTNCYPGDDVVDIVGIDNYDHYPSAASKSQFDQIAAAPEGMTWLYKFATAHKKKFSVGEWGVAPGSSGNTTGENPAFIQYMHDWFAAHAANLAYEAYFNGCAKNDVESNLNRAVTSDCVRQNKSAGSKYKSLFGS